MKQAIALVFLLAAPIVQAVPLLSDKCKKAGGCTCDSCNEYFCCTAFITNEDPKCYRPQSQSRCDSYVDPSKKCDWSSQKCCVSSHCLWHYIRYHLVVLTTGFCLNPNSQTVVHKISSHQHSHPPKRLLLKLPSLLLQSLKNAFVLHKSLGSLCPSMLPIQQVTCPSYKVSRKCLPGLSPIYVHHLILFAFCMRLCVH